MHRLGVAIVVLVAVGVAIVWLWPTGEESTPREGGSIRPGGEPAAAAPVAVRAPLDAPAQAPLGANEGEMLRVRVIDAGTQRAVADATVLTLALLDDAALDSAALRDAHERDVEACYREFGIAAMTDAVGEASLPRSSSSSHAWRAVYVARAGDRYGEARLEREAESLVIRLERDSSIAVEIEDHAGRPAVGVHVRLRVQAMLGERPVTRAANLVTDARGRAAFPHVQTRAFAPGQRSEVLVREPGIDVAPVAVDVLAPPAEPLRFRLPPSGVLEVVVPADPAATARQSIEVRLADPAVQGSWTEKVQDGRARFAWIGLGREYEVEAWTAAERRGPFRVAGPLLVDETVVWSVPRREEPVLRFRALDDGGKPIAAVLQCEVTTPRGTSTTQCVTDGEGRGVEPLDKADRGSVLSSIRFSVSFVGEYAGYAATIDGGRRALEGIVDLGDVVLALGELWAAGRCVDEIGAAVSYVSLPMQVLEGDAGAKPPVVRRGNAGAFELRGGEGVRRVRLQRGSSGPEARQTEPVDVAFGARDVVVRFQRPASLDVDFVHAPGAAYRLDLALWPEAGGAQFAGLGQPEATESGTHYALRHLPPGRYRFTATVLGESAPRVAVDGVELRGGENDDPRLRGLVLSDVRLLRIELVDAAGRLLGERTSGTVFVRDGETWRGRSFMAPRIELLVRAAPVDVVVAVTGHAPIRRERVTGDFSAQTLPLPRVPIELAIDGETSGPVHLSVLAEPLHRSDRFVLADPRWEPGPAPWLPHSVLQPGKPGELLHDGPGEYRLRVFRQVGLLERRELTGFAPTTFTIPASGAASLIALRVPAGALGQ